MIKGTSSERIEYCKFIENYRYEIDSPFQSIDRFCRVVHRYYLMRMTKNHLSRFEVSTTNLVSLTYTYTTRILDLVYIWVYNEGIPLIIEKIAPRHPKYYIRATEITELIWDCPESVLTSMLLKADLNNSIIEHGLEFYENSDKDSLAQLIKENVSSEVIYTTFQIVSFANHSFEVFRELDVEDEMYGRGVFLCSLKDIVDAFTEEVDSNTEFIPYIENLYDKIEERFVLFLEKIDSANVEAVEILLKWSLIIIKLIHRTFAHFLGNEDPIVKEMNKLVSNKIFMKVEEMYSLKEEINYFKFKINRIINFFSSFSQDTETTDNDSELSNEVTEITLTRFFDDILVFDGQKREEFINKYVKNLFKFFSIIDKRIALYSFASLFYPIVLKRGRYSKDKITAAKRLSGGIQWKKYPENENEVIELIMALNPIYFNRLKPCRIETLSPARRMDYLIKLYCDKSFQYSWIKDFIEDYWPQEAREEFEKKYKIKK